eukprot:scaffold72309_cov32-Tisochrysis_lutea.AAC.1
MRDGKLRQRFVSRTAAKDPCASYHCVGFIWFRCITEGKWAVSAPRRALVHVYCPASMSTCLIRSSQSMKISTYIVLRSQLSLYLARPWGGISNALALAPPSLHSSPAVGRWGGATHPPGS